jgi:hypothetical protein
MVLGEVREAVLEEVELAEMVVETWVGYLFTTKAKDVSEPFLI